MDGNYEDEWSVEEWLEKGGLAEYTMAFIDNGYDTPELCASLKVEDLDAIGISNKYHRSIIFTQARQLHVVADTHHNPDVCDSSCLAPTSEYSEPWAGGQSGGGVGKQNGVLLQGKEAKKGKKAGKEKAGKSSKQKSKRPPAPVISPSLPPYSSGGSKLTRLQLKLKLREELQKDGIILSEAPYCKEDGTANEALLVSLGERYAAQFGVDSLEAYDAIDEVFKHTTNTSAFVTSGEGRKISKEEVDAGSKTQKLGEDPGTNYDEPFDTQKGMGQNLASRKANKSKTMPANRHGHYDEPFDTVTVDVTGRVGKITAKGKPEGVSSTLKLPGGRSPHSSPEETRHSVDDTSRRKSPKHSPKTSPKASPKASPKTSPKTSVGFRLFRKKQKPRSHSVKDFDSTGLGSGEEPDSKDKDFDSLGRRKHGSAENIQELGRVRKDVKSPKRTSVSYFPFSNSNPPPLPPNHPSRGSADSSTSESDGSPHSPKKPRPRLLKGFHSPPTYHRAISNGGETVRSGSFSGGHKIERMVTKTSSDMEINKLNKRDTDARRAFRMSQSHEELRNVVTTTQVSQPTETEKQKKEKGNFIRRLFKWKSSTPSARKRTLKLKDSAVVQISSLTSSVSMPEINRMSVEPMSTDYAEVFDTEKLNPERPQKPPRHFQKSPLLSTDDSPPFTHRRMVIKSGSDSSTTDHLVIPIQSGSAPEQMGDFLRSGAADDDTAHSPELEDIRFSDSEDQRSERTTSFGSSQSGPPPPTPATKAENLGNSPRWRHSVHTSRMEETAVYKHDSRSTSSAERGSSVLAKPLPPPKPKKSIKGKPSPPSQSQSQSPATPLAAKPPSGDPPRGTSSPPKPPPKPARSKHRSMKIDERVSAKTESAPSYRKSRSMKERTPSADDADGLRSLPAPLEKSSSEHSLRFSARLGSTTSTDSSASDGSRKPKPLPKPRALSKPAPPPKAARVIETVALEKLTEEGIDLTQMPYSTVWGEGAIPYPLVTRYAEELRQNEARVAQALDTVRGRELKKYSREHVPMAKEQWQRHPSPCKDSIEALLTSIGLPMYADTFKNSGFSSVQQILSVRETELETLQMKSRHREILVSYIRSL